MRVCVVGSGGREHALACALGRSADVVAAPGNPGICGRTREGHRLSSSPSPPEDIEADLYVIGPEAPLVDGLADRLREKGKLVLGPGADGARLEGSKVFMKELVAKAGVPTAGFRVFESGELEEGLRFLGRMEPPYVVKTDGLASGKGVLVTSDLPVAQADLAEKLSGRAFGRAGRRVVIEEGLSGTELSVFALSDGKRLAFLGEARDHKRLGDGDTGPNTGGMGAFSPVEEAGTALLESVAESVLRPTLHELCRQGTDYRGILYAGLMLCPDGAKLLEYNVRLGDPEAEVLLPRLGSDLVELFMAAAAGALDRVPEPSLLPSAAVCAVAAAPGYPADPQKGGLIWGVEEATTLDGVQIFHAGTARGEDGSLRVAGGRVLCATGIGKGLEQARERCYGGLSRITFDGMHFRRDIGVAHPG